jgi:hypothetical protein
MVSIARPMRGMAASPNRERTQTTVETSKTPPRILRLKVAVDDTLNKHCGKQICEAG